MAQFNLPQNSKIEVGEYYKDKTNSKNLKKVNVYRWDPIVLNARLDFPLPLLPVKTTNLFLGICISIFCKLFSLAPNTEIDLSTSNFFNIFLIRQFDFVQFS